MAATVPAARLAVAKLLRVRGVDISAALKRATQGDNLQVCTTAQLSDTRRRAALFDELATGPAGFEKLLILPRAAAEDLFSAGLDASHSETLTIENCEVPGRLLSCPEGEIPGSSKGLVGDERPAVDSMVVAPVTGDLAVSSHWTSLPSLPLSRVAASMLGEQTKIRAQPVAMGLTRGRPSLAPDVQLLFDAVGAGSLEGCRLSIAACIKNGSDALIRHHPDHGGTCLHVAAGLFSDCLAKELVIELCESGANLDARAANNSTPLHWAAGSGNEAAVSELLRQGADPSLSSYTWKSNVFGKGSGQTAMHWAAESGHTNCIDVLLEHGSALGAFVADERGLLPADLAAKDFSDGHFSSLDALTAAAESDMVCVAITTEASIQTVLSPYGSLSDAPTITAT